MNIAINWSKLYEARNIVKKEFPSIWNLPLIKKEMNLLEKNIHPNSKVLEIGAGDRRIGLQILKKHPSIIYKSFDIDNSTSQDFYELNQITGKFDLIYGFELIEHLSVTDGLGMISTLRNHLTENGCLILGTPNLYHPHRYFGDLTHVTPYKYEELGSLLVLGGYKVDAIYRKFNAPFLQRIFRIYLFSILHKWLDIDFAKTILIQARKA